MSIPECYMQGKATILVSLKKNNRIEKKNFLDYLQVNKFDTELVKEKFEEYELLWININSKMIHHGLIGCPMCEPLGNHEVTIKEFKSIFEIFKRYNSKQDNDNLKNEITVDELKEKIKNLGYELKYVILEWNLLKEIDNNISKVNRRSFIKR